LNGEKDHQYNEKGIDVVAVQQTKIHLLFTGFCS